MSHAKAVKHARNVRKCRAQSRMHFGFDTGIGAGRNPRKHPITGALITLSEWFRQRNVGDAARRRYVRECVREQVQEVRALREAA